MTTSSEERWAELDRRLSRVEEALGIDDAAEAVAQQHFDERDARVLQTLKQCDPEIVTVAKLHKLYKRKTDIRQKETLRDRTRTLLEHGPFEKEAYQKYRYTGGTNER